MKKRIIKALAILLSITLLIQIAPVNAVAMSEKTRIKHMLKSATPVPAGPGAAAPLTAEQAAAGAVKAADEGGTAPIIGEELDERDENTKHFRHMDGTYTAAMYAEPVHFRDAEGRWQDIDNRLQLNSEKRSAAGEATYTPAASGLDIRIPQDFENSQKLTISKDGYTVGLGVIAPRSIMQPEQAIPDEEKEPPETEEPMTDAPPDEEASIAPDDQLDLVELAEEVAVGISAVKAEVNNDLGAHKKDPEAAPNQTRAEKIREDNAAKMDLSKLTSSVYTVTFSPALIWNIS